MDANTQSTVPSTNEDDDYRNQNSLHNTATPGKHPQQSEKLFAPSILSSEIGQMQLSGTTGSYSSPRLESISNEEHQQHQQQQQAQPNVGFQHTISDTTPVLKGEDIVLLSYSNETTLADTPATGSNNTTPFSGDANAMTDPHAAVAMGPAAIEGAEIHETSHDEGNNILEDEELNDMTLSPSSIPNVVESYAHSPPAESIYSDQLTALTPPPISLKSSGSNLMGGAQTSGSQSLFSRDNGSNHNQGRGPIPAASAGVPKRPPLPPRWAIGSANAGVASSHHAGMIVSNTHNNPLPPIANVGPSAAGGDVVDVVPAHLPPPKQIGPLSHRRVLSTGDASFLSNLTDPDSMHEQQDDNSPPTAANASGSGVPPTAPPVVPSTTCNVASAMMQAMPANSARKRGVSWDFGTQAMPAASYSESDSSINRYKKEEESAFDTLGILQPILGDENLGSAMNLMQPILMDDDDEDNGNKTMTEEQRMLGGGGRSAFMTATNASSPIVTTIPSELPPPPPPPPVVTLPEKVVQRQQPQKQGQTKKSSKDFSKWDLVTVSSVVAKKNDKDATQFEGEAEVAILKALNGLNHEKPLGGKISHSVKSKPSLTTVDDDDHEDDKSEEEDFDVPVSQVVQKPLTHRKDMSELTTLGFDTSLKPPNSLSKGESIFEDSAWTEEYDAAGRIDGTLPEEGLNFNLPYNSVAGAAAPMAEGAVSRPPLTPPLSFNNENASKTLNNPLKAPIKEDSKRVLKEDSKGASSRPKGALNHPPSMPHTAKLDPTKTTGLRHRRNNTIAAKGMADELAQIAALHSVGGGMISSSMVQQGGDPPLETNDRGGIGNLLAGVEILVQQVDGANGENARDKTAATSAGAEGNAPGDGNDDGDDNEGDNPAQSPTLEDEETGNGVMDAAAHAAKKTRDRLRHHQRGRRSRSEKRYHLKMWYRDLIQPKIPGFIRGATHCVAFIIVPLLSVAFILFYAVGNPIAGRSDVGDELGFAEHASWSWWVVFLVRQAFLLSCVKAGEVISIDILALRTPLFLKTIGSFPTLMIAQARGWPYVLTFWSIVDFCCLFGSHRFAKHWLFWQDWFGVFNADNPAGNFLESTLYMRILLAMMFVGVSTSLKRLWIATFLGKRSYAHYGPELEIILAKMLLVSQIAHLARQLELHGVVSSQISTGYAYTMRGGKDELGLPGLVTDSEDENSPSITHTSRKNFDEASHSNDKPGSQGNGFGQSLIAAGIGSKLVQSMSRPNAETRESKLESSKNLMSSSAKLEILALLEEWEEPDIKTNAASKASIKDILQFRQAVSLMNDTFPFTPAFGPAKTRSMCVESSEKLFHSLLNPKHTSPLLRFETLSEIAYSVDGKLMRDKVKAIIKLFRPDRRGFLTKLDFVSSIDDVYKDLRLFRASLANSSSIDDSFALIINIVAYIATSLVVLLILGFDSWEPILSFSAFLVSLSFMFGPASSKYFEGILLIFIRRPYDIGDKIALSDPENDTSASGSSTWFVEKVTLFTTTVRFATTNEVATYSNGSLARLRVINAKRSPKAIIYVYMKFGSDVSYKMIKVYQAAIENFVKSRPREWAQLNGFRATRVEMELNFIEYVIVATHREMWQNVGPILQSKADLASFSLEVSKKLNLRYHNPPKPIHLSLATGKKDFKTERGSYDSSLEQVANLFGGSD